ncbi:fructose-bisphosphate aldolase (plasmid) [Cellulomonas sp. WB94]|uniref:class I fructose-bisphosphate aldolase n=1 Tax=Cellulomonas sp. WB94 TaxID=2173174 RepID=UPI000D57B4F8|nr:fructose-bisphosphate aldolase [Cellulomonas sp. WB94]PVU81381.1 fructose-bisphosphate aldolase [Cellulomonas sp. WB94]
MSGAAVRLGRLLNKESRRSFMVAFDRTLAMGPEPYAEDSGATITAIAANGADAILLSPGLVKQHGHLLAYRNAPAIVCRIDFPFLGPADRGTGEAFRLIASVEEAAALGADAVVMFHTLGYREKGPWADNLASIGKVAQEARRVGLPLIVEAVPWGAEAEDPREPRLVAEAARIAAELGADAVKTEYVGSIDDMRMVVDSCPVPVFVLGGPRVGVPELLRYTADSLEAGASGVIYGRNVWQREDCAAVSAALAGVVHGPRGDA